MKKSFGFFLRLVLLTLLPWHAFLKTWLSSLFLGSNADFLPTISNVLSLWKEILLAVLIIVFLVFNKTKGFWQQFTRGHWVWLGAYVITLLLFAGIQAPNAIALILGIRTDLLFVPVLFLGILVANRIDKKQFTNILWVSIISLSIAVGIGILAWFVSPDIGVNFGYSPYQSSFVENKPLPVYHCLFIDEQCIPRLQATFSGPNQAGSLMILLLGLLATVISNSQFYILHFTFLIPLIGLALTFSRSAIIGAIVSSFMLVPRKIFLIALSGIVILTTGIFVLKSDLITHGLSSSEHWEKTIAGITRVIEKPLGTGFGTAGPVSRRLFGPEKALISENWYLQIAEEGGIVPSLVFIAWLGMLIYRLFKKTERFARTMAFVLLATSLQAFFLHLWEDSVVTMLIWFFVGLALSRQKYLPNHQDHQL